MQNYSKSKVVLVKYPFTDLVNFKVRPAIVISKSRYNDIFIVPLTSKTVFLKEGEFILHNWKKAGLNIATAVKRGIYTIDSKLILKEIGYLTTDDFEMLKSSVLLWLDLKEK